MSWTNANGGDWETASNWSNDQVPGPNDNVTISLSSTETITHNSTNSDSMLSLSTNGSTNLKIVNGSLSIGASSSTFGGPVTVNSGATLGIGATASVQIDSTLIDSGALNFATGDNVSLSNAQIAVNGTMTATSDSFNNAGYTTSIAVNSAGELTASNTTFSLSYLSFDNNSVENSADLSADAFNLPIYVPYNDVQYLGNNATFDDVNINSATLSSGTLNLNQIGTASSLRYVFPNGFTVASGATIDVAANIRFLSDSNFFDYGALNFATGDNVSLSNAQIAVNGTMTTTSDTFNNAGYTTSIAVNSAGELTASNTTFSLSYLSFDNNSVVKSTDLSADAFNLPIYVPYNDVQYLGNNATFDDVNINSATLSSGTLNLNQIGTASSLRYVFPNGFTVASGATIDVAANIRFLSDSNFFDYGALNFATGDNVSLSNAQIAVNGTMTTTSDTFNNAGYTTSIAVNSAGELTASNTTFSLSYLSFDNNSVVKSTDLSADAFNLPIYVPYNDVQYLGNNATFDDVNINSATLSSGTLNLNQIGTASSLRYVFPNGFTVASGATIDVAANIRFLSDSNFFDYGALNFATGDNVSLSNAQIAVNGTMTATSDSFNNAGYTTSIAVNSAGELTASNTTFSLSYLSFDNNSVENSTDLSADAFNLPIYVPYNDVQYLGNNATFDDVNINSATLSSGTLNLNQIGTASSLRYVFPNGFTVASGATIDVAANIRFLSDSNFFDYGALNFATGDNVSLSNAQIAVNGTMTTTSDTFNNAGYTTSIAVNSAGELTASNTTFSLSYLSFDNNSVVKSTDLSADAFNLPIYVPYNDVQYLGNNATFDDVNINSATLSSGTLNLNQIGTASSLRYVFPNGFTVASGATIDVAANIRFLSDSNFFDYGALNFATGDNVSLSNAQIAVNGTMTTTSDTFNNAGYTTSIAVNSAGELTASNTTFSLSYLSFDNNSVVKSTDLSADAFNLPIYVPYNDVQYLGNNATFDDVNINSATLSSGTLNLNQIGTASSLRYVFPNGFTVASGATIDVAANIRFLSDSNFFDYGALNFATGDNVSLSNAQIAVNGTMTTTSDTFNNAGYTTSIAVNSAGELTASNTTFSLSYLSFDNNSVEKSTDLLADAFNLPIYVPYNDVQYLGNNATFDDVNINSATLSSGQLLTLNQIGTASSLRFVFPNGFIVASGATLDVGTNVKVLVDSTLTDGGALNFASGDAVQFYGATIAVNGTMTATGASFTNDGYTNTITVNSGGTLNASNSSFSLSNLILNAGSNAQLAVNSIANEFSINSGATISITGNNFSNISNNSNQNIVASGDPNATINLTNNYWGTTNTNQIAAKITDHTTNSNLPTISYSPPLSSASAAGAVSATAAANTSTGFSSSSQTISLSATVTSGSNNINEGSETFLIVSGINIIGSPVTVSVANGAASTSSYTLPAGTAAGTYTIQAIYYGTGNYLGYIDTSHTLTINAVSTTTAAVGTSTNYSTVAQSVPLTATITSAGGTVNGGTVTFTILNGGTTIATATSNTVTNGAAAASVTLPAGTAVNNYTIQAAYSGSGNFGGSSDSSQVLTVNSSSTTTTVSSLANPSVYGQLVTFAATVVASSPGLGTPAGHRDVHGRDDDVGHRHAQRRHGDLHHLGPAPECQLDHGRLRRQHQFRHQHLDGAEPDRQPGRDDHDPALLNQSLGLRPGRRLHGGGDPDLAGYGRADWHRHVRGWHDEVGHPDAQRWDDGLYRHGTGHRHPLDHRRVQRRRQLQQQHLERLESSGPEPGDR